MQFTAYITRSEVEKHAPMFDAAVSRIAQIFAADVMPQQSRNYDAKCAMSYVDVDKAAAVSRGTSKEAPLLVPPALFTSSTYVFQGYHPGYLESFLLRPLYNTVVGLRANPTAHTKIDYRTKGLPSPSTINKAILRIPAVNPQSSFNCPSSSLTPQVTAKRTAQQSRIDRLASPGPDALFGAPIQSKLFVSQPPCTDESSSSVSSTSTIDYWDGEDESFSQGLDDAMSSTSLMDNSVSFKGKGRQHAVAAPRALSKLAPIISMGPETESALIAAGLPDTVHTYLRDLVGKRVTTGWILSLQNPPLSLSSEIAAAVSAAVHRDINNVH
ncbi:hypothetical protein PILCRDRAFT_12592 [Piloderma croceum F 1598]|uniref:Uncharacterized protein n=1 Tax=Piloderma croceum (strain F 1598) TaxID=765440 RepID=A0A0C3FAF2_PILCF|nr:hypothetical protein PILCRDRAFT_12592 [Piloderma croceum F 1598]